MKTRYFFLLLLITLTFSFTYAAPRNEDKALTTQAISPDQAESAAAISVLRYMGNAGVKKMLSDFAPLVKTFVETGEKTPDWLKFAATLDAVAMQKDSYASGLYWYTDLEKAKAESARTHKPILSLRLLGNLNEELSCANSRFFRSVLYPNSKISAFLRDNYILHWQSVRPAPRVTIDFGDGRKMETTLTGNSIHYILDENGRVLDAIPGLYAPDTFFEILAAGKDLYDGAAAFKDKKAHTAFINSFFRQALATIEQNWGRDLQTARLDKGEAKPSRALNASTDSITASRLAVSKSIVETRILPVAVTHNRIKLLEKDTDADKWKSIAALYQPNSTIDESSRGFIGRKLNLKGVELDKLVKQFEQNLALDTVRNQYLFHSKIYVWLSEGKGADVTALNENIYATLFLTPNSDPWLGLFTPETFNGIENSGITK